jgi:tetratricopeptide (TPR) repeat protein
VAAKTPVVVRVTSGDHPGYSRVVLDAPGLSYSVTRDGGRLLISLPGDLTFGELPALPRNVLTLRLVPGGPATGASVSGALVPGGPLSGGMELTVAPRATIHDSRMGTKIVIDIDDSVPSPSPAALPQASKTGAAAIGSATQTPVAPPPATRAPLVQPPAPGPAERQSPNPDRRSDKAPVPPRAVAGAAEPAKPPRPGDAQANRLPIGSPSTSPGGSDVPAVNTPGQTGALAPHAPETAAPGQTTPPPDEAEPAVEQSQSQQPAPAAAPSDLGPAWPVVRDAVPSGPTGVLAVKARPPAGLVGVAIQVPFPAAVGAALYSRGADSFVVFDERRPIDLAALRDDPVFGSAVTSIFPAATVIRLTRPAGKSAMLSRTPAGWRISIVSASPRPAALTPVISDGAMAFAAQSPGQVVTITDPRTGGALIVGTQLVSGQGVAVERRTAEFLLPVTGQGIVVMPLSDAISLRIIQAGFVLSGRRAGLVLSPPQPMQAAMLEAAGLTRLFEFPRQTTEHLAERAQQQGVAAAMVAPLKRGPPRYARAESLLGLGLGVEAQTLLKIAMRDDPREAASPTAAGLAAIAALLAGRPREAGDLADPRLTGTDEIELWRAIQTAMTDEGSPGAAAVLATTAPLLLSYPAQLRRRVLPLALETMILGGQAEAAAALLALREDDPTLAYARALLTEARGDKAGALTQFDAVANTRSQFDHARASVHATELRLAMGQLDAKGAADALEERLYAWRGDGRDLALRLRVAELRGKAGAWRTVFDLLRAARVDFPGHAAEIDHQLREAFAAVPRDPALGTMPPTELIALLEENAELMADGPDGEPMRALLAEKLMALDLPKRADPLLTKLMRAAPYGPSRAGFGATLATLRLHEGDGDGAIVALSESNSADMADPVRERRALITARVEAKRGDTASAVEALTGSKTQDADETRAAILEQAKDWPGARDALAILAARVVPDSGVLNDAQLGIMLRLATAAARAGDDATLAALREKLRNRLGNGPSVDLFRLLTAEPVRGTADLARARSEMGLARAITADINPKKSAAKTP